MTNFIRSAVANVFFCAAAFLASPAQSASVKAQGPCLYTSGACLTFFSGTANVTVAKLIFNMPGAGSAVVMFNGTMQCSVNSASLNTDVVDLAGQIVNNGAAVPDYTGPGGNHYAMRQLFPIASAFGPSTTMNLASTRTFTFASGGNKPVFYKIGVRRMDADTSCTVFSAAFTVLILP